MLTAEKQIEARHGGAQRSRVVNEHCRICQEYEGCWGDCPGAEGLGLPSGEPLSCFRQAETRHGELDPETGNAKTGTWD